jgi:hypothetical protein
MANSSLVKTERFYLWVYIGMLDAAGTRAYTGLFRLYAPALMSVTFQIARCWGKEGPGYVKAFSGSKYP